MTNICQKPQNTECHNILVSTITVILKNGILMLCQFYMHDNTVDNQEPISNCDNIIIVNYFGHDNHVAKI